MKGSIFSINVKINSIKRIAAEESKFANTRQTQLRPSGYTSETGLPIQELIIVKNKKCICVVQTSVFPFNTDFFFSVCKNKNIYIILFSNL